MKDSVLVTGGNGYIGTQTVMQLKAAGYEPVVVDWVADTTKNSYTCSFDDNVVLDIMKRHNIKSVIHFAADHEVGRSVEEPSVFYNNNVVSSIRFLDKCIQAGVEKFIFSSSSSVYGDDPKFPTTENNRKNPMSPYGRTKDMFEEVLKDYDRAYGIKTLALRYFNAAGADPLNRHGYCQDVYSHLVPILARCFGQDLPFTIFGRDYDTPDGTCIRDYTHVYDIADAHIKALEYEGPERAFNIGTGKGESVIDVINAFEDYTGKKIQINYEGRRLGDPAQTFANIDLAINYLNWNPIYSIEDIVEHAYKWENR